MVRFSAFVRLIRPMNCLMMGFAVIVGAALVGEDVFSGVDWLRLLLGFLVGFFLTGGSMAVNDIVDREIDAVNEPGRSIPSGLVSVKGTKIFAFVLGVVGFAAALAISLECLLLAAFAWLVFSVYSVWGKRAGFWGNLLVSVCVVVPLVYGGFVVGRGFTGASWLFVVIAFLSNTGREILKGIADVEGDRKANVRTLAVSYGLQFAAVVAVLFFVCAVALSVLPLEWRLVSTWFVPFVLICDVGLVASIVWLLRDFSRENARRIKRLVLIWLLFGLLAFLAGTVS